uniref:Small ribosomal subunit protein uS8c n=2 Tax=Roya TaxID=43942 RepID=A0A024B4V0_9VIRI|nr:ribosomal protein S8 [Roya anglica]YP_009256887.1 ribosomal protein S8 [Roya obtusa]AHZ11108.1 ribosomal protein S8 [Roya anglica]ANI25988.1 ribosomal protein S8 [Roya obtusa]
MGNDTIASMITSIRNANLRKTKTVEVPATNTTRSIGKILLQEGFIEEVRERQEGTIRWLVLTLRYQGRKRKPYITTVQRVSKPGLRVYSNHKDIPKVLGGMGIVILSTSQGMIIDREARERKIGGEILCYVW